MASKIIVLYFVVTFLLHEARCEEFVTVKCLKSEITSQYGTNTILDCVIQTQTHITDTKIDSVSWRFQNNNNIKTPQLVFREGKFLKQEKGFHFAASNWNDTNMNVSLLITNTDLSHTGQYECNVGTNSGGGKAEVHLTVKANYSKPQIYSTPEKRQPEKYFILTCEAHGGFPKGDLRWIVDSQLWMVKPEVQVTKKDTGLLDLSTNLTFKSDTQFKTFVCEVYNANGVKEGEETFHNQVADPVKNGPERLSLTQIVAPVVVIGSLIVGLLLLLLFCRRQQRSDRRRVPPDDFDEEREVVALNIDSI